MGEASVVGGCWDGFYCTHTTLISCKHLKLLIICITYCIKGVLDHDEPGVCMSAVCVGVWETLSPRMVYGVESCCYEETHSSVLK